MRGRWDGNAARRLGGALRREIANWANGGARPRGNRCRKLCIEPLESRQMMDVAGAISAAWFAIVAQNVEVEHAAAAQWTAEDAIIASAGQTAANDSSLCDWIIQFDTAALAGVASVADTVSLLAGAGFEFEILRGLGLTGMVLARSSGASIDDVESYLSGNSFVAAFEQDAYRAGEAVSSASAASAWDSTAIDLAAAWTITSGSTSVVVAAIDTGVDYNHVALRNNIWTNPGEIAGNGVDDDGNGFVDDVHGYDFANRDGNPMDDNGHGTHVAGTIISTANCSVMALKFLGSDGSGYLSDAISAVNYATMMRSLYGVNVRVDNNSWGGGGFSAAMKTAIAAANDAGILFVAAAGNESSNNDSVAKYPANYDVPNVLSVAASTQTNALADFSNYGMKNVDLAAPGVAIVSTTPGNTYSTYSGTSMAAPHVSAVAALAWALCPTASVADVRDAILDGAKPVSALSAKVATGGVLNAYNTLKLLRDSGVGTAPVVGSLSLSASSLTVGATVTMTASGIAATTGSIAAVRFVLDANNNGVYDAGDAILAASTAVVGGQCSATINTAGWTAGTHTVLAAAQNSAGQWSNWVSASLDVLPPDDHGNSAAAATRVAVPGTTAGRIELAGDSDWFAFEAAAGKTYVFTVALGTLADSVLYLYDTNGATRLAMNDDYGSSCASQITWTAPAGGTYYLKVAGYGDYYAGTYSLAVAASNAAPTLSAIGGQTLAYAETTLTICLGATDADGDALTFTAAATAIDPLAQKAYAIDRQLNLHAFANGSYYQNARGLNEKYVLGTNNVLYYLLPNGALYRLNGGIAKSVYIDTLSPAYYENPALLHSAQAPSLASVEAACASVTIAGDVLTITRAAGYGGALCVTVSVSDGIAADSETFTVADPLAARAYNLDQSFGLRPFAGGNYYTNARGAGEKYMLDPNNVLYFLLSDGSLYRFRGSVAKSTLVARLSAAYYENPALLHDAYSPSMAEAAARSANSARGLAFAGDLSTPAHGVAALPSLERAEAAMAWLAVEHGAAAGFDSRVESVAASTTSSIASEASFDCRAASLRDEVFKQYADPCDSRAAGSTALSTPLSKPTASPAAVALEVFEADADSLESGIAALRFVGRSEWRAVDASLPDLLPLLANW